MVDEPVPATVDASILDSAINAAINRTTAATRLKTIGAICDFAQREFASPETVFL